MRAVRPPLGEVIRSFREFEEKFGLTGLDAVTDPDATEDEHDDALADWFRRFGDKV